MNIVFSFPVDTFEVKLQSSLGVDYDLLFSWLNGGLFYDCLIQLFIVYLLPNKNISNVEFIIKLNFRVQY